MKKRLRLREFPSELGFFCRQRVRADEEAIETYYGMLRKEYCKDNLVKESALMKKRLRPTSLRLSFVERAWSKSPR